MFKMISGIFSELGEKSGMNWDFGRVITEILSHGI